MIQTHTVGFCGPFRSRSVTLLLDPTTLGKPDFRSRTLVRRRTHSDLDYLLKYTQRYTVVYLGPIRSLLDPFQVSHTIIGTSDSLGLPRTHSELPGLGLSPWSRTGWPVGLHTGFQISRLIPEGYIFPNRNIYLAWSQSTHLFPIMSSVTQLYQYLYEYRFILHIKSRP